MKHIQTLAQKSVYWFKVIALGLILGIGIQFAQAWTSPDATPPPGGNVSGPITNSITPQYKTGMLGVNSAVAPTTALEVGGGGNALIGGSVNATAGTITGVLASGKVQIVDVVVENTACTPNGLVARDNVGLLLSCQSGIWKKASGGGGASCVYAGIPMAHGEIRLLNGFCSANGIVVVQCLNGSAHELGCSTYQGGGGPG